ncbi:hypothetical protein QBC39DRAFT_380545 [Podospora conica]|nr:hypothetical protein QBC39DRAFT_380545 [Schizothecium conicum]
MDAENNRHSSSQAYKMVCHATKAIAARADSIIPIFTPAPTCLEKLYIFSKECATATHEDIATTIDGGEKATDEQKAKAIISCGIDGGTLAVQVNATHPVYKSAAYIEGGYSTKGLLVKITKVWEEEV